VTDSGGGMSDSATASPLFSQRRQWIWAYNCLWVMYCDIISWRPNIRHLRDC